MVFLSFQNLILIVLKTEDYKTNVCPTHPRPLPPLQEKRAGGAVVGKKEQKKEIKIRKSVFNFNFNIHKSIKKNPKKSEISKKK